LPFDLKRSFRDELEEYEREQQMPYVTSIERMGIEQGIEQGIERGIEQGRDSERKTIALNMLRKNIPLETIAEVTGLTIDQLQQLQSSDTSDR
jgi:predicted transposase/invertase (TIGR01784 family)